MYKKIRNTGSLQLSALLAVMGFCSVAHAQVVVTLEASGNKLVATSRGTCAKEPNPPGCTRISGRTNISFNLAGGSQCGSGGGSKWQLDHVALGTSEDGNPGDISAVAASDFNASQSSGRVTAVSKNANHILIRDNNTEEYDIWYTVYASCGGSGELINSDPRLENTGTGR